MRKMISIAALVAVVGLAPAQSLKEPGKENPKDPGNSSSGSSSGTSGGGSSSSTGKSSKSGLEKALDEALKNNPDLHVAAARMKEAEAVFTRTRLQVTQKVVAAYQAVELAKATVKITSAQLEALQDVRARVKGGVSREAIGKAEQDLAAARSQLATAEADLNYLLGKSGKSAGARLWNRTEFFYRGGATWGDVTGSAGMSPSDRATFDKKTGQQSAALLEKTAATDKLRKALDRRISLKLNETTARDALKMILKEAEGLHIQSSLKGDVQWDEKITANLKDVPLGAVLQLLEDAIGARIAVRSYGLLIASESSLPKGAVLLGDFWPARAESKPAPKK